ncbi:MAG: hypothetical protein JNL38_32060 [Myxococcales bacterium]|nr:hypothetical protein [Myxococcales bacterium]
MVQTVLATLGVLIGIRVVFGLIRFVVRRRLGGGCSMGRRGFGPHGRFGRFGGFGQSRWLRRTFAKLDTTPGQEREIKAALDELRAEVASQRAQRPALAGRLADALEADVFDDAAVMSSAREVGRSVELAASRAMRRIAAALDEGQRRTLASWLRRGPAGVGGFGGPYRAAITL